MHRVKEPRLAILNLTQEKKVKIDHKINGCIRKYGSREPLICNNRQKPGRFARDYRSRPQQSHPSNDNLNHKAVQSQQANKNNTTFNFHGCTTKNNNAQVQ